MLLHAKLRLRSPSVAALTGSGRHSGPSRWHAEANTRLAPRGIQRLPIRDGFSARAVATEHRTKQTATHDKWTPSVEFLYSSLASANSMLQLQELLTRHGKSFSDHHWLTALYRLPSMAAEDSDEHDNANQVRKVLVAFQKNASWILANSSGDTIADIITVFAIFKQTPSAEFYQVILQELLDNGKAARCTTDNFCNIVISLAKLQMSDIKSWAKLLALAEQHADAMTGTQVMNVLLAIARISPVMQAQPHPTLLAALAARARACLGLFNNSELSTLCYALGSVGLRDSTLWDAILAVAVDRVREMPPSEVSKLARGLAMANQRAPQMFDTIADMVLTELRKPASANPVPFDVQVLGEIMGAFTKLGIPAVHLYAEIARDVAKRTTGLGAAMLKSPELRRWITCVRKQQGDAFMYGFFLSILFGVAMDQMVGATVSFVTAWWVMLRPMLTEAAAGAYAQLLSRKRVWYGFWLQWIFTSEEAEEQQHHYHQRGTAGAAQ